MEQTTVTVCPLCGRVGEVEARDYWRHVFAGRAMQALLNQPQRNWSDPEALAKCAIQTVEALLLELQEAK